MKGETVEIIKIGNIMKNYLKLEKDTVMVISDGDSKVNFYVSIFINKNKDNYNILKTTDGIVSQPFVKFNKKVPMPLIGVLDDYPKVGKMITINDATWHTSKVIDIIEDCIVVTMNSIYALHTDSNLRNIKLNKLI
jgi:hypothetical protein